MNHIAHKSAGSQADPVRSYSEAAINAAQRYPLLTPKPFDPETNIEPDDVIDGIVPIKSVGFLYGQSSTKKSFIAVNMCLAVAGGVRFGSADTEQGAVFYCAGEGQEAIEKRIGAQREKMGLPESAPLVAIPTVPNLRDSDDVEGLAYAISQHCANTGDKPQLIVIDTLSRALGGGDNNSNQDINAVFENVDRELRDRLGCAVLVVAHMSPNSTTGGIMGATNQFNHSDFVLKVDLIDDFTSSLSATKMKDGSAAAADMLFQFDVSFTGRTEKGKERYTLVSSIVDDGAARAKSKGKKKKKASGSEAAMYGLLLTLLDASSSMTRPDWKTGKSVPAVKKADVVSRFVEVEMQGHEGEGSAKFRDQTRSNANRTFSGLVSKGFVGQRNEGDQAVWLWIDPDNGVCIND